MAGKLPKRHGTKYLHSILFIAIASYNYDNLLVQCSDIVNFSHIVNFIQEQRKFILSTVTFDKVCQNDEIWMSSK